MRVGVAHPLWVRIQRELNTLGMAQAELVRRSGIPASTISNLKSATRPPLARVVKTLASTLGIDENEAMVLAGRAKPPLSAIDLRQAIERSEQLTEVGRTAMLAMFDALQSEHAATQRSQRRQETA